MLWASTDLCFLDLPDEQPPPFYYRTDKLRLYYPVTPNFWAWLKGCVESALASATVPQDELDKVMRIESYVSERYRGLVGKPILPDFMQAEDFDLLDRFVAGEQRFLVANNFIAWRPLR